MDASKQRPKNPINWSGLCITRYDTSTIYQRGVAAPETRQKHDMTEKETGMTKGKGKFESEFRPWTPEERKAYQDRNLHLAVMSYQCTAEEYLLACKEDREPRPIWETHPDLDLDDPTKYP